MLSEPGAAMQDTRLFTSRLDGAFPDLYERRWDGDEWVWVDHGSPPGMRVATAPGAAMMDGKLFVGAHDGHLDERARSGTATPAPVGRYALYVDRAGEYRWRLRRPDGEIVADSGQGYRDRAAYEADLRWIREHGADAEVRALDLP